MPRNVPALTDQCPENKMDSHRYHSISVSSIGSMTLPSAPQMLNHSPRQLYDEESSSSLTVQNRPLFGHSLPPDNHSQNLDHAKAPAPYVLTSPYHPIPASQHSMLYNRVYCAAKHTDDDGGCTPFYNNVQGAGKRSDDASTAICQSINFYCPVKRTSGDVSNVSSYDAVQGACKRSDDASAASQTINRYCPVTDKDFRSNVRAETMETQICRSTTLPRALEDIILMMPMHSNFLRNEVLPATVMMLSHRLSHKLFGIARYTTSVCEIPRTTFMKCAPLLAPQTSFFKNMYTLHVEYRYGNFYFV